MNATRDGFRSGQLAATGKLGPALAFPFEILYFRWGPDTRSDECDHAGIGHFGKYRAWAR